jgi:hypothetical protein
MRGPCNNERRPACTRGASNGRPACIVRCYPYSGGMHRRGNLPRGMATHPLDKRCSRKLAPPLLQLPGTAATAMHCGSCQPLRQLPCTGEAGRPERPSWRHRPSRYDVKQYKSVHPDRPTIARSSGGPPACNECVCRATCQLPASCCCILLGAPHRKKSGGRRSRGRAATARAAAGCGRCSRSDRLWH